METSNETFRAGDKDMPRGSFVLWEERNPSNLREILSDLSANEGVPVQSIHSSLPDSNRRGIASELDFSLKLPKEVFRPDDPASRPAYGLPFSLSQNNAGLKSVPVCRENLLRIALTP